MIVNGRNTISDIWTIPNRYNCTDCKVYPVGRGALPTPTSPECCPGETEGPATKLPRHCEGRQARGNPHPKRCEASPDPRGVGKRTDCHVASLLAMTVVFYGWSFYFTPVVIMAFFRCRSASAGRPGGRPLRSLSEVLQNRRGRRPRRPNAPKGRENPMPFGIGGRPRVALTVSRGVLWTTGLPRRLLAPRNDGGFRWLVLSVWAGQLSLPGRRGQCRPPYR